MPSIFFTFATARPASPTASPTASSTTSQTASPARALQRLLLVSTIFVLVYFSANYLTSLRSDIGVGVFDWERAIPFIEWTVVPYLSIFLLLPLSFFVCRDDQELQRHTRRLLLALALAAACYAAFPLGFHFTRPEPQGPLAPLFGVLWSVDLPFNRAPSLHIVVLKLMWPRLTAWVPAGWLRVAMHAWLAAIGVSVLTTYQHHVIDIVGGVVVAGACFALTLRDGTRSTLLHAFGRLGAAIGAGLKAPRLGGVQRAMPASSRFAC